VNPARSATRREATFRGSNRQINLGGPEGLQGVVDDRASRLAGQALAPVLPPQEVCELDLVGDPVHRILIRTLQGQLALGGLARSPRQEPAAADQLVSILADRRPEPVPVPAVVDVDAPLQLLPGLLVT
jgi:hypothetical protein